MNKFSSIIDGYYYIFTTFVDIILCTTLVNTVKPLSWILLEITLCWMFCMIMYCIPHTYSSSGQRRLLTRNEVLQRAVCSLHFLSLSVCKVTEKAVTIHNRTKSEWPEPSKRTRGWFFFFVPLPPTPLPREFKG